MYIGAVLEDGKKHITLAFCGHGESKAQYKGAVRALAVIADKNWGVDREVIAEQTGVIEKFGDYWVTLVASKDLEYLREMLCVEMEKLAVIYAKDFEFRPHITMTKWDKPKKGLTGTLVFDRLSVMSNEFGRTDILL